MSEVKPQAQDEVAAKAIGKYCPRHGVKLVYMEVDGMMGWQCPVEGCLVFIPDPI